MMNSLRLLMLFAIACVSLTLMHCSREAHQQSNVESVLPTVHVGSVVRQSITEMYELNGVTQFQKKDIIRATNTGYITILDYKPGDKIDTGVVFCSVETKEQHALKHISKSDSVLRGFQRSLNVISNASGIITAINVLQGDYIAEGDILASVSEPSSLVVVVSVPFEFHSLVHPGVICDIVLPDSTIIHSAINGILPVVNTSSQSQSYFIRLPHESLPENLNVTARLPRRAKVNALCVPTSAIQTDEVQRHFWVMKFSNSRALKVPCDIGLQSSQYTEILNTSLAEHDTVITNGSYALADSTTVRVSFK